MFKFCENKKALFFVYIDNSINSIEIFWSLMQSSHCFAMLPINLSEGLKINLEKCYNPKWIYDPLRTSINGYKQFENRGVSFFELIKENNQLIHEDIKILLSTSGTTGSPKFVKLSENNLISNAQSITKYLPINETGITPLNLPIFYSYGLSILTSNSINGGRIVCTNEDVMQKSFWDSFNKFGYTSMAGVPFMYEMLYRIGFTKKQYPSLKYLTQAGGKLQDSLLVNYANYSRENNVDFYVMYGQTEATARISYLEPNKLFDKLGSIGKPIPGGGFSIDEESGELFYQGENIFGGYVNSPEGLETFEQPKILATGDLAFKDEDGFYFIKGRLKRFVKLFGYRINLDEVETLIANHTKYIVKCIGVDDKYLVVFHDDTNLPIKIINQFITDQLKLHASVIKNIYLDKYPLTDNGKINYKELLKIYES
jgi:long-subunit acyl-CoA synthetase (AMP-forming)